MNGCDPERRSGFVSGVATFAIEHAHALSRSEGVGSRSVRRPQLSRRLAFERFGDRRDVLGRVAAAAAGNIDQPSPRKIAQITRHVLRPQIEPGFRERIRQAGIRVARDRHVRLLRELLQERIHQIGTERAVEPHRQRFHVLHRVPERLSGLRGDHASRRHAPPPPRSSPAAPCRPASNTSRMATSAALAFSESKIVSTRSRSTPPAMSARTCCA